MLRNKSNGYKQALFAAVKTINLGRDCIYRGGLINEFNQIVKNEFLSQPFFLVRHNPPKCSSSKII